MKFGFCYSRAGSTFQGWRTSKPKSMKKGKNYYYLDKGGNTYKNYIESYKYTTKKNSKGKKNSYQLKKTKNIRLYAVWKQNEYDLVYRDHKGTLQASQKVKAGQKFKPRYGPINPFGFHHWNTGLNSIGQMYFAGREHRAPLSKRTLYARHFVLPPQKPSATIKNSFSAGLKEGFGRSYTEIWDVVKYAYNDWDSFISDLISQLNLVNLMKLANAYKNPGKHHRDKVLSMLWDISRGNYRKAGVTFGRMLGDESQFWLMLGIGKVGTKLATSVKIAAPLSKLVRVEINALRAYTGKAYININNSLRGLTKMSNANKIIHANMQTALKKASLPKNMILYRGTSMNGLGSLKNLSVKNMVGKTFKETSYLSTSIKKSAAQNFQRGVLMTIRAPKGSKGLNITSISMLKKEVEVLFQTGREMRVLKAEMKGKVLHIEVELLK